MDASSTAVVALGGNALLRRGEPLEAANQARAALDAETEGHGFRHRKDTELEVGVAKSTGRPTSVT